MTCIESFYAYFVNNFIIEKINAVFNKKITFFLKMRKLYSSTMVTFIHMHIFIKVHCATTKSLEFQIKWIKNILWIKIDLT